MPFQIFQFYDIEKLAKCRSNLHRNRKKLVEFALEEKKIPEFPKKTKKKSWPKLPRIKYMYYRIKIRVFLEVTVLGTCFLYP